MSEWSDPGRVAEYLGREIPHRQTAEEMLVAALPDRVERFIDLGTGDGRLIAVVRTRFPNAQAVGLDSSAPMLAAAAERIDETATELRHHDLAVSLPELPQVDAIVSGLAIHHLEHDRKQELFAEIRGLLRSGGVFLNLELVASATPGLHERFRREIGRVDDDPADRLAGLEQQMGWLRNVGLVDVDCHFKWLELALIVGRRP